MVIQLDDIISQASTVLPLVPLNAATLYQQKTPILKKYVDDELTRNPTINCLVGNNPLEVMYDNHGHHAAFMSTVFIIGNYELLARTIPWVYRAYSAQNFSYDYFPVELEAWIVAVNKFLPEEATEEIVSVYRWMIDQHKEMIYLSENKPETKMPIGENWLETKSAFLAALLEGNYRKCLDITDRSIAQSSDLEPFYMHIVQPVMYEIGMLWERAEISVAQEHLASSIVSRVMAATSTMKYDPEQSRGKVVISAAQNEFHEIGAWMISDILERDGWQIRYLGANTPTEDLLALLKDFKPDLLVISVTMPFNIAKTKDLIGLIKSDAELSGIHVLIGGRVFNDNESLWRQTGADYFATNVQEAKKVANQIRLNL